MSFLRVPSFTLIYYLLFHFGFCKAYQNCLVASIKITTVYVKCIAGKIHLLITLRSWLLASVYTIKMRIHFLRNDTLYNVLSLGLTTFSQEMSPHFDSVNTGELPTSECNQ